MVPVKFDFFFILKIASPLPKGYPNRFRNGQGIGIQTNKQTNRETDIFVFIIVDIRLTLEGQLKILFTKIDQLIV